MTLKELISKLDKSTPINIYKDSINGEHVFVNDSIVKNTILDNADDFVVDNICIGLDEYSAPAFSITVSANNPVFILNSIDEMDKTYKNILSDPLDSISDYNGLIDEGDKNEN